jgi:hypothetical protein
LRSKKKIILNYFFSLDTVRHTPEECDFDALRSNGCLKVTLFLVVERFEVDVLRLDDELLCLDDELVESHGLPYKLRIALRLRCLFV